MKTSKTMLQKVQGSPDSEAWFRLVDNYDPLIKGWLKRFGVNDSDLADISQEVFFTVTGQISKFDHNGRTGAFRKWLKTITINRCRRYWASNKKHLPVEQGKNSIRLLDQLADPSSDLSGRWDREHDLYVLNHILQLIGKEFKSEVMTAFRRFTIDGEPAVEIANDMGVPVGQIYKFKFRVMQRLQDKARGMLASGLEPFLNEELLKTGTLKPNSITAST